MTIKPLIDYSPNDLFKNIMFNSYSLRKPIFAFLEVDNNDVAKRLLRTITAIKEENMREQLEIKENGMWDERARGTMIAVVMNSAYTLALKAVKKMNDIPADIEELKILNSVFALIDSKFKNRNLTISFTNNQLSINFLSSEAFENGTAANSPDSIRYLPLMTVLFNANHRNGEMLKMFMKACEQLNPIRIIKLSTEEFSSSSSVTHNMIDLHNSFLADQLAIYSQSISFTECIALSQKYKLSTEEPLIISQALPQFSIPLNILRKKYFRMSQTLRRDCKVCKARLKQSGAQTSSLHYHFINKHKEEAEHMKKFEFLNASPPSSSDVERLFSTAAWLYSEKKRNRLLPTAAVKLLYLASNYRISHTTAKKDESETETNEEILELLFKKDDDNQTTLTQNKSHAYKLMNNYEMNC